MTQYIRPASFSRSQAGSKWGVSDLRRRPAIRPPKVTLHIKLFPDLAFEEATGFDCPVVTGTDMFVFFIDQDMDLMSLTRAAGYLSTVGDGDTAVTVRNKTTAFDLLVEPINIESEEESTYTASTFAEPLTGPDAICRWGNLIGIDVTDAAADSHGLGVILEFSIAPLEIEPPP